MRNGRAIHPFPPTAQVWSGMPLKRGVWPRGTPAGLFLRREIRQCRAMAMPRIAGPADAIRGLVVRQVRAVFNDRSRGEQPVVPSADALFEVDSPIRLVHADVVAMMVGGIRALLLQMLHPAALQGVLDHSDFREDIEGRLRRTARFIAVTTYGHRAEAEKAIASVNAIHVRVTGTLPNGEPYAATDPHLLAWVHLAEATSFLEAYLAYVDPRMLPAAQDRYFEQSAIVAEMLGATPLPRSRAEAALLMAEMRKELAGTAAAREVAAFLLDGGPDRRRGKIISTLAIAAVDLLPPFARMMLDIRRPGLASLPSVTGTHAMASIVRWAFAGSR